MPRRSGEALVQLASNGVGDLRNLAAFAPREHAVNAPGTVALVYTLRVPPSEAIGAGIARLMELAPPHAVEWSASVVKSEAHRRLLTPLTNEEAAGLELVTREKIDAALAKVDRMLKG